MIVTVISTNEAGQRFDKYLKKLLREAPGSFIYKMLRKKNIVLNGKKADGNEKLSDGDEVKLFIADDTYLKFTGRPAGEAIDTSRYEKAYRELIALDILYEDNDMLIVDKPAGILTQKAKPDDISVNEWLTGYMLFQKKTTADALATFKPSVCNRLDRNTSGIVVCGKTLAGSRYLSGIIKDKSLEKYYHCIVAGEVNINGRLTGYLYKDASRNKVTIFDEKENVPHALRDEAEFIDTAFRTVKNVGGVTLLEVRLFTGKAHQIRAQLSSLGHPIIGDAKYGDISVNREYAGRGVRRQLLHAHKLIFPQAADAAFAHTSGMVIECPVPEIFEIMEVY